jgi:hypothetical protein
MNSKVPTLYGRLNNLAFHIFAVYGTEIGLRQQKI